MMALSAISANEEERVIQQIQLSTALSDSSATKTVVDSWVALPVSGAGARYTDIGLGILETEIITRDPEVINRITEINTALGTVTDNLDGTYSGTDGDIYYERFKWLDARLNKVFGTAIERYQKEQASDIVQAQIDNLNLEYNEFSEHMVATKISEDVLEESNTIIIDDSSIFTETEFIYIASETQAEIILEIIFIDSATNAITFSTKIPAGYLIDDIARVYKMI